MSFEKKSMPVRWGIFATGWIAEKFTKDLLIDPATRQADDISHTVVAAASSSSADRAQEFLTKCGCPKDAKAYGSYLELVHDPNIDIIYVATPHSHHFQNVMLCLKANKHVLCEKAFTVNAKQAELLYAEAKARNLFLMEAVWIRFFPLCQELRQRVAAGEIGRVHRVFADLSFGDHPEDKFGNAHRMLNLDLAGGAMLDLGIYSLTWLFQFLYHIRGSAASIQSKVRGAPRVASSMSKFPGTGADEKTSIVLTFPGEDGADEAHGIATTCLRTSFDPDSHGSAGPAIRIQGDKGELQVFGPAFRPQRFRWIMAGEKESLKEETRDIPGHGMFWEADECARCLRDGKTESETMTYEESIVIMKTMDEVRRQNGLKYPQLIESADYDENNELNAGRKR